MEWLKLGETCSQSRYQYTTDWLTLAETCDHIRYQ